MEQSTPHHSFCMLIKNSFPRDKGQGEMQHRLKKNLPGEFKQYKHPPGTRINP